MTIDEGSSDDTMSVSNANTEPADTAAEQASQETSTHDADDSSGQAPQADPQANEGGSSKTLDTTLQTADQDVGEPAKVDWQAEKAKYEKRIADLRAGHGRTANELHQYRKRYEGIDPEAARKALEARKQPEHPVWHPKNPDNRSFSETKAAFQRYENAMRNAETPEERAIAQKLFGKTFTEKEVQQLQEWRAHQQRETERMASDPDAYRERIREEVQEQIRSEMQGAKAEAEVERWFSDAANQQVVERYREEMIGLMNEGWSWSQVQRYIEAKSKADGLQSRVGSAEVKSAAARAQQAALKTNAKVSRDPAQAPVGKMDFTKMGFDYAKKHGLHPSHERVMDYVAKAVANWRASQTNPQ